MIVDPGTVTMAKQNGRTAHNLYVPPGGDPINVDQVVDLLAERTSPRAQPAARALLRRMAVVDWLLTAGVHRPGYGGDLTRHVNVVVDRRQYHVRLDAAGCVFDVTFGDGRGVQRPGVVPPWVPPGA
jgi:hypothetical protein